MVLINPITLQFDDEDAEQSLRAGTLDASQCILALFALLDILCRAIFPVSNTMFDPASGASAAIAYTCTAVTHTTVLYLCYHGRTLPKEKAATFQDRVWSIAWAINVTVWWCMQGVGLARRLTAAEGHSAAVICAMWGFVMVLQHVLHIGFKARTLVLLLAASIALTSVSWEREMLAALTLGEAIGYCVEHMMRSSFLLRAEAPFFVRAERVWNGSSIKVVRFSSC